LTPVRHPVHHEPMDPGVTARVVVERMRRRRQMEERRAQEVRARLPEVTRALVEEFQVRRIVVFGSLLSGRLHEGSDLDLLVEGLQADRYFEAMSRIWEIAGIPPDLVPIEEGREEVVARALRDGEVLHEP
jgi:predicted nucleotidyltransferase